MATLTARKPKNTYKDLLQVSNSNAGIDGTLRTVDDGEGTASPLKLSSSAVEITSALTLGGNVVSDTDSTDDLGTTSVRWANVYTDSVGDSGQQLLIPSSSIRAANNPAFLAYNSADDNNVTGTAATGYATVDFDTEVFDQGSDFAADTFTAPVTGRYLLMAQVRIKGITAAADTVDLRIVTSNRTYQFNRTLTNSTPSTFCAHGMVIADMDASDTVTIAVQVTEEASDVVDIHGGSNPHTYFSGCLIT